MVAISKVLAVAVAAGITNAESSEYTGNKGNKATDMADGTAEATGHKNKGSATDAEGTAEATGHKNKGSATDAEGTAEATGHKNKGSATDAEGTAEATGRGGKASGTTDGDAKASGTKSGSSKSSASASSTGKSSRGYSSWTPTKSNSVAINGCTTLFGTQTTFSSGKRQGPSYCTTKNPAMIGSMVYCLKNSPYKKGLEGFVDFCAENSVKFTMSELDAIYNNASKYVVYDPVNTIDGWNKSAAAVVPIAFTDKEYKEGWKSAKASSFNVNYSMWFGIAMLSYWFGVLFIAGLCNLTYYLFPNAVKGMNNKVINTYRKYISLPTTFQSQRIETRSYYVSWFQWIVPTRLENFLMLGYIAICIAGNTYYVKKFENGTKLAKLLAVRTGVTSMWVIPQLILFAGRNNFMLWLSGWGYDRFINIHKWNARVMTILVFIHTIAYTISGGGFHTGTKLMSWFKKDWMIWGCVALACMCILCVHSLFFFRHMIYEIFLVVHIVIAVFAIIGGWIHCRDQGYQEWYIAATAVWVFDRVVRIARILFFGIRTAEVQLLADETLRVTVARPSWWKTSPGAHIFVHFFRSHYGWQSHPFTFVEDATPADSAIGKHTITSYVKVKNGVTKSLYNYLSKCPGQKANIKVGIEGPYGHNLPFQNFASTVFFTGGHGVPGLYAQARQLVGAKTNVKFYWAIRHYKSVEWFYQELQALRNCENIQTIVYISQPEDQLTWSMSSSDESQSDEKKSDIEYTNDSIAELKAKLSHVEFREGRPNIEELVKTECEEANGSVAFTTCGHGAMVDTTRKAVAENLDKTKNRVDLFEQSQVW